MRQVIDISAQGRWFGGSRRAVLAGRQRLRVMVRCRSASVAAEFAMVMPLLFMIVMGTLEFGTVMFAMSGMQTGATMVARQLAVNDLDSPAIQARMKSALPDWISTPANITVSEADGRAAGHGWVTVSVSLPPSAVTPLPMFTYALPFDLRVSATAVRELPYNG